MSPVALLLTALTESLNLQNATECYGILILGSPLDFLILKFDDSLIIIDIKIK